VSEITPKEVYLRRREFLASAAAAVAGFAVSQLATPANAAEKLAIVKKLITTDDPLTPYNAVTTYNNFYEFGTDKGDPARNAKSFKPKPWSVAIEGACGKPGSYTLEDILKPHPLEERIYRHRCVEGWSMVIPWIGFPLADLLKRFEPSAAAKYVEFVTVQRPQEMSGQRGWFQSLAWPYLEGLRIDEAMNPLALIAVGLYGEELLNQNGAPLRLVVPWKYGFKSAKSIAKIRFVDKEPRTSWMKAAPEYYGFYSNVNPAPTNSSFRDQSTERRIGDFAMRKTLPFNGYGEQVASLYAGLDLRKNY
jgi:sulfoxide reductase catalytic subunit YedY